MAKLHPIPSTGYLSKSCGIMQVDVEGHGQSREDTYSSLEQRDYQLVRQAYTFPTQTRKEGSTQSEMNPPWNPPFMILGSLNKQQIREKPL